MTAPAAAARNVLVSEVGPRDGLQSVSATMPTPAKLAWIDALAAAGLPEIEVGSYVPPRLLPQMADIDAVVAHALGLPGLAVAVLVPNLKGAERAVAAGVHKITVPVSVSEAHSLANVRMTRAQAVEQARAVCALRDAQPPGRRPRVEGGLSTAFGCTIQGAVPEADVVRTAVALAEAGVDEVGLSDTTGMGDPAAVRRLVRLVRAEIGDRLDGVHLHNTRGLGLANALAAWDVGIRTFDSSQGGIGGCPWAPGATGNVVTEDLVAMFEAMGVRTGVDLDALMRAREVLAAGLPGERLYGYVPEVHGLRPGAYP